MLQDAVVSHSERRVNIVTGEERGGGIITLLMVIYNYINGEVE